MVGPRWPLCSVFMMDYFLRGPRTRLVPHTIVSADVGA